MCVWNARILKTEKNPTLKQFISYPIIQTNTQEAEAKIQHAMPVSAWSGCPRAPCANGLQDTRTLPHNCPEPGEEQTTTHPRYFPFPQNSTNASALGFQNVGFYNKAPFANQPISYLTQC